ncbi:MAG: ATP-binding protein [Bdellovibrionales bacterium]|nr:ATP-binding protein [Bdellovibrionales bacterium]
MGKDKAKLYLICGKIASGKSTLAKKLADENSAILLEQDKWLATLYPEEIVTIEDYIKSFKRLSAVIGPHVIEILKQNISVVLDFPGNTLKIRSWMKNLADQAHCPVELHFLDVSDEVCLKRLQLRNESNLHEYKTNEDEFFQISKYFEAPSKDEGVELIIYKLDGGSTRI